MSNYRKKKTDESNEDKDCLSNELTDIHNLPKFAQLFALNKSAKKFKTII